MTLHRTIHRRAGFTLIEISVGLIASSFLLMGLGSSIFLATQANRVDIGPFRSASQGAGVIDEVTRELSYATTVRSVTPGRNIEVEVPDRTGDGAADVVRYQWSGTAGDPLQRLMNGGAAKTVIPGLQSFGLTTTSRTVTEKAIGTVTGTSGEVRWYEKASALLTGTFSISPNEGVGCDFIPQAPDGALTWSITKVEVYCQSNSTTSGVMKVRVWTADSNRRPDTLLAQTTLNESSLNTSMSWTPIAFSPAPTLAITQRGCITIQYQSGLNIVMQLRCDEFTFPPYWRMTTTDGGATWSQQSDKALYMRVYGKYTYPAAGIVDVSRTFMTTVGLEAQAGTSATSRMRGSARVRNLPAVAP
jgi:type II secretory pathway pseudopilin PulG